MTIDELRMGVQRDELKGMGLVLVGDGEFLANLEGFASRVWACGRRIVKPGVIGKLRMGRK